MKSTKIVCTIGPRSQKKDILVKMIKSGMNVARLNMSHGDYAFHKKSIDLIRQISKGLGMNIAIMIDLQGPKIRTGKLLKETVVLKKGALITLTSDDIIGDWNRLSVNYAELPKEATKGEKIYLDDGNIELKVVDINGNDILCKVMEGGVIRSYRGVNLPETKIKTPSLTEKDLEDLEFGLEQEIDFVALSFVRKSDDIYDLKERISKRNIDIPIVAKIEKPEAIKNIDSIIKATDSVMVARGDLGAETSPQDVPILQKMIISKCNNAGKPVITATQMLESMINHPRPTRAEASDVANAIFDGSDAVMLSGETALGDFPVESVRVMSNIARKVEEVQKKNKVYPEDFMLVKNRNDVAMGVSYSASQLSALAKAKYIIAFTLSGRTALNISMYRPPVPILGMSPSSEILRKMSLYWGVYGVKIDKVSTTEELLDKAERILINQKFCKEDDTVIFIGGVPVMSNEPTNMVKVHRVKIGRKNI